MDDYYSMLGVDAGASVDDIRDAYRTRKNGLDTASDTGKADAAKLNKAWNVLSDPYQRGRYDEKRAQAIDDDELEDADEIEVRPASSRNSPRNNPRSSRQEAARKARDDRRAATKGPPSIPAPPGTHYPKAKQRFVAMGIDLFVLVALFVVSQFLLVAVEKNQQPAAYHARQGLVDTQIPNAQKQTSADNKSLSDAKTANNQADIKTYTDKVAADKRTETDLNKQLADANKKLPPVGNLVTGSFFLFALVYLIAPSMLIGRTLGKRSQGLRVVRESGSALRLSDALKRYGSIILASYALSFVVGPLAGVIVLFGVTMWTRNPNQQGIHDRFAHTIVVADDE